MAVRGNSWARAAGLGLLACAALALTDGGCVRASSDTRSGARPDLWPHDTSGDRAPPLDGPATSAAHYPFNGSFVNTSDGAPADYTGDPGFVAGVYGQALSLDGDGDCVHVLRPTDDFSIAFWLRTRASGPTATIWYTGESVIDGEVCGSPADGDWGIALVNGGHLMVSTDATAATVNDGTWHAIVLTRERSASTMRLYLDGAEDSRPFNDPGHSMSAPTWLGLGCNPCNPHKSLEADIDELHIYSRVLSPAEIAQLSQRP
jgi:hypothetical protein